MAASANSRLRGLVLYVNRAPSASLACVACDVEHTGPATNQSNNTPMPPRAVHVCLRTRLVPALPSSERFGIHMRNSWRCPHSTQPLKAPMKQLTAKGLRVMKHGATRQKESRYNVRFSSRLVWPEPRVESRERVWHIMMRQRYYAQRQHQHIVGLVFNGGCSDRWLRLIPEA